MRAIYPRTIIVMIYDIVIISLSFYISIGLRSNQILIFPFKDSTAFLFTLGIVITTQFSCLYFMQVYRAILRFSSIPDLIRIFKGAALATPLSFLALFLYNRLEGIPRTSFLIDWIFLVVGLGFGRLVYRMVKDGAMQRLKKSQFEDIDNTIIVGAGVAGDKLLREIQSNHDLKLNIIGFVDDQKSKIGKSIRGMPIWGPTSNLKQIIKNHGISQVLIAMPSASNEAIKNIFSLSIELGAKVKILPKMSDILNGEIKYSKLRNVEPVDLLGRVAHDLDIHNMSQFLSNKIILVTGAGGSIGSELTKQICRFNPKLIILFEMTELFLYELENFLKVEMPDILIKSVIGDVRNFEQVKDIFQTYNPDIVFHAAAYKHVPLMELNPLQAIRTNIVGTYNVAINSIAAEVDKFVLISTDKAINPTNVMGATKRISELICQNFQGKSHTKFITVRFGNVLGSSGSVIPTFKKQIEKGGPVEVTHKDITRYFMSIPEATQLVIQAGAMGNGGEIMVLDMGEPIKILDLAHEMIKLAGLEPNIDIQIKFIGLRPGEKLYEELFHTTDEIKETNHPMVKVATTQPPQENFETLLNFVLNLTHNVPNNVIKQTIKEIVPEYDIASIDQKENFNTH